MEALYPSLLSFSMAELERNFETQATEVLDNNGSRKKPDEMRTAILREVSDLLK